MSNIIDVADVRHTRACRITSTDDIEAMPQLVARLGARLTRD
jgi:hypothetical protein